MESRIPPKTPDPFASWPAVVIFGNLVNGKVRAMAASTEIAGSKLASGDWQWSVVRQASGTRFGPGYSLSWGRLLRG